MDDDTAHDEARYRVEVVEKNARVFEVRIPLTAKAQAKPSPEQKIEEWYAHNALPRAGAVDRIPGDYFSPHYF
jgi:hypothetical protein